MTFKTAFKKQTNETKQKVPTGFGSQKVNCKIQVFEKEKDFLNSKNSHETPRIQVWWAEAREGIPERWTQCKSLPSTEGRKVWS